MFPIFGIVVPWGWFISCKPSNIFLCFGLNWICWPVVLTGAGGAPFRSSEQGLPPSSPLSICNICQRTPSSSSSSAPHFQKLNKKKKKYKYFFRPSYLSSTSQLTLHLRLLQVHPDILRIFSTHNHCHSCTHKDNIDMENEGYLAFSLTSSWTPLYRWQCLQLSQFWADSLDHGFLFSLRYRILPRVKRWRSRWSLWGWWRRWWWWQWRRW